MDEKFGNLRSLILDMKINNNFIQTFNFSYKKVNYIGLIKRFLSKDNMKPYEFSLEFMKYLNIDDSIKCIITYRSLKIDKIDEFKSFFQIDSNKDGNFRWLFESALARAIPTKVNNNISSLHRDAAVRVLSISDSEDPNKIYCNHVKRHEGERSPYNSEKTRLLRPRLYEKLKDDKRISFCYYSTPDKEKDDAEILLNFSKNIK